MDINEVRRANLRELREKMGRGAVAKLAAAGDTDANYISSVTGPNPSRNLGDDVARRIEVGLRMKNGALDMPPGTREERAAYGPSRSPVAAAIKQEQEQDGFAMLEKALARLLIIGKRKDDILDAARIAHAEALEYQQAWEQMMREQGGKP